MGFLEKLGFKKKESLEAGLEKSREGIVSRLSRAVAGKDTVDDEILDELEEILIRSDVGVPTTLKSLNGLKNVLLETNT
jgi:fused signal recognition particle receptor